MLRRVVGWVRLADENWRTTMCCMNTRLQIANQIYQSKLWGHILYLSKFRLAARTGSRAKHSSPQLVVGWSPQQQWQTHFERKPSRRQGRPPVRWDDSFIIQICCATFRLVALQRRQAWYAEEQTFVMFCGPLRFLACLCPYRTVVFDSNGRKAKHRHTHTHTHIQ